MALLLAAILAWFPAAYSDAPAGPVACVNNAETYGLLNQQDAYRLCVGSSTSMPFDCYQQAERSLIPDPIALQLCKCTLSTSRVSCYNQAHSTTELSDAQILDLCTHDANASPDCAPSSLAPAFRTTG